METITKHYTEYDEQARFEHRHNQVEFRTTLRYIEKYLAETKNTTDQATTSTPEDVFVLVRKEDIDALMKPFAVTRLHYVATTLVARFLRDKLAEVSHAQFELYLRHHFAICERPDMVGMTSHSLDIFRKG